MDWHRWWRSGGYQNGRFFALTTREGLNRISQRRVTALPEAVAAGLRRTVIGLHCNRSGDLWIASGERLSRLSVPLSERLFPGAAFRAMVGGEVVAGRVESIKPVIIDAHQPATRRLKGWIGREELHGRTQVGRVLLVREQEGGFEPWTWVRDQGRGPVLITAAGHDPETWARPEFLQFLEQSILWTTGKLTEKLPPLRQVPAKIPQNGGGQISRNAQFMQAPPLAPGSTALCLRTPRRCLR